MKVYVITGNHPNLGHYMRTVPLAVYSNKDDAEFFKRVNDEVFGWSSIITEIELDGKISQDARQSIINAGITIPQHLEP